MIQLYFAIGAVFVIYLVTDSFKKNEKNNTLPHAQILNNLREYIKQQGINNNVNHSKQGHSR